MNDFSRRIADLENKLKNSATRLKIIVEKSLKLKDQNRSEIQKKEQELEDWRNKLEVLRQEKKKIDKEIKEKVKELEQSQLSNTEKQSKINKLLTEHSEELGELDKLFNTERNQYGNIRNKLISKLCQPCEVCPEKERAIKILENRITNLKGLIILAIITSISLFLLFLYSLYSYKREREREREQKNACRCK